MTNHPNRSATVLRAAIAWQEAQERYLTDPSPDNDGALFNAGLRLNDAVNVWRETVALGKLAEG